MNPISSPLYSKFSDTEPQRSLDEQYHAIFSIVEKYKPEVCLSMIMDTEYEEFHHILWDLPFYENIYKIDVKQSLFRKEELYCQIKDAKYYNLELFRINIWRRTKKIFEKDWNVEQDVLNIRSSKGRFDEMFEQLIQLDPISYAELPEPINRKILFSL